MKSFSKALSNPSAVLLISILTVNLILVILIQNYLIIRKKRMIISKDESKREHMCFECNKEFESNHDYANHVVIVHPITKTFIKRIIRDNSNQRLEIIQLKIYTEKLENEFSQ